MEKTSFSGGNLVDLRNCVVSIKFSSFRKVTGGEGGFYCAHPELVNSEETAHSAKLLAAPLYVEDLRRVTPESKRFLPVQITVKSQKTTSYFRGCSA